MMPTLYANGIRRIFSWYGVLIVTTVLSLTVSVATRYNASSTSQIHTGSSSVATARQDQKTQRLDKYNFRWIVQPASRIAILPFKNFEPRFTAIGPSTHGFPFDKHLYNRPPPSVFS